MSRHLDQIDVAILDSLQNDARLSNKELAARVGMAPSSSLERVRRLERDGVIRGYHARLHPPAVGVGLEAMISIRLDRQTSEVVVAFRRHLDTLGEVLAIFHIGGAVDFLVHVAVSDSDHLGDLVMNRISNRREVAHMETAIVFEHSERPLQPLAGAVGRRSS